MNFESLKIAASTQEAIRELKLIKQNTLGSIIIGMQIMSQLILFNNVLLIIIIL